MKQFTPGKGREDTIQVKLDKGLFVAAVSKFKIIGLWLILGLLLLVLALAL